MTCFMSVSDNRALYKRFFFNQWIIWAHTRINIEIESFRSSWIWEDSSRKALSGSELLEPTPGRWDRYIHVQLRGGPEQFPGSKSARELSRAVHELFKSKCSINVFNLWKMRSIFKKCSWSIWSNYIIYIYISTACVSPSRENRLNRSTLLFN